MKPALRRAKLRCWYYTSAGTRVEVTNEILGTGDLSGITGNLSGITGDLSGITGDLFGIRGDLSGITGDIDYCEVSDEERAAGVRVDDLVAMELVDAK